MKAEKSLSSLFFKNSFGKMAKAQHSHSMIPDQIRFTTIFATSHHICFG